MNMYAPATTAAPTTKAPTEQNAEKPLFGVSTVSVSGVDSYFSWSATVSLLQPTLAAPSVVVSYLTETESLRLRVCFLSKTTVDFFVRAGP